jgi:transposase, IS5 family
MRPKKPQTTGSGDLSRARLDQIINLKHELAQLARQIDWALSIARSPRSTATRAGPGSRRGSQSGCYCSSIFTDNPTKACASAGSTTPISGTSPGKSFSARVPHERPDLSHWRKRLGDRLELLLAESLRLAHKSGALRRKELKRVTVDTRVQPKNISFPTDAKLLHAAIRGLNRLANKRGVRLRQSYLRVAKRAAMKAGRYAHAKQFNRHSRERRILPTRLGRLIRDIGRKIAGQDIEAAFALPLVRASQIRGQQQRQRGWKLYSFHAPETECIGNGKPPAINHPSRPSVSAGAVVSSRSDHEKKIRIHRCRVGTASPRAALRGTAGGV